MRSLPSNSVEQATRWFWATFPPGCVIELLPLSRPVRTATDPVVGWLMAGDRTLELGDFLSLCQDLTGEPWRGSLDNDGDLTEYVRGAVLAAYGRPDACAVRIKW